jgi:D-3-phosphoglycerate dehydrogenase
VSILAEAMGMRVQFYDILPTLALGNAVKKDSLEAVLQNADFVSLHVPGTPQTDNLIDADQIKLMKKGSYLLNASRGNVVNLEAVKAALLSKHLAGAAIDVFPYEPADKDEPFECCLQGIANVILTPHIGGSTEEAQVAIGEEVARKMVAFINSGQTIGSVNLPEMQLQMNPETHRILNIHSNVPGVLRDINTALGDYNVVSQILMTKGKVGYMIIDVDKGMSHEVKAKISQLKSSIRTRILY